MRSVLLSLLFASTLSADSSFLEGASHAYSANTGWIHFKHDQPSSPEGVVVRDSFTEGYAYSGNVGWIHFGSGAPSNGISYANDSASDYGVNHDGEGNLSGYAYSANTGWINFGWAAGDDANRPQINLLSGIVSGYAYSANLGWINLGTGHLQVESLIRKDSDNDTIDDSWEMKFFGNLTTISQFSDSDGDGTSDADEYQAGTDPTDQSDELRIVEHDYDLNGYEVTLQFLANPNRTYSIQYTDDLSDPESWTDSNLGTLLPNQSGVIQQTITFPGSDKSRYFFRVVATTPLQ